MSVHFRVQGPKVWHAVYTTCPTISIGGHFFVPEFTHLTEFGRQSDTLTQQGTTNHKHPSVAGVVMSMMNALPQLQKSRGTLYFLPSLTCIIDIHVEVPVEAVKALCRMVMQPTDYVLRASKAVIQKRVQGIVSADSHLDRCGWCCKLKSPC